MNDKGVWDHSFGLLLLMFDFSILLIYDYAFMQIFYYSNWENGKD